MQRISDWTQRVIEVAFYALFFITPFIFNPGNSELFEMPKMYFIYSLTAVIVGGWLITSVLYGKIAFRPTLLDLPLLLFLLSQIVSAYFSIDHHTSIFGYYSRINGGLLSLISYSLLYWAYISNMDKKSTLITIHYALLSATIVALWAILEHFGFSPSCLLLKGELNADCWVQDVQARVFATLGQPNWLAAFLIAVSPLALVQLLQSRNYTLLCRGAYFLVPLLLIAATVFTKSRSGLLGLGAVAATFVFFHLPNKLFLHVGYLILIAISGIFLWQYNLADCFDLNPNQLTSSLGTESCKIRTIVWKGAIDIWKNNPVFGSGPETFAYSYYNHRPQEHNLTSEWELLYNKAHNEYLNYLANTGIIGLGSYLLLIVFSLISVFKNLKFEIYNLNSNLKLKIKNSDSLALAFLSGYVSILVTNFFGFSISLTNLLFFLYPAMALQFSAAEQRTQVAEHRRLNIKILILLFFILCSMFYVLLRLTQYWQADVLYAKADKLGKQGLHPEAAKEIKDALFKRSDEPLFYNKLAELASYLATDLYESQDASTSAKLAQLAIDSASVAVTISPYNLNFLKNQSLVFSRLSLIYPTYIKKAIPPLEQAIKLAPTDPKVHYNLGVLYQRAGESQKALELIKKARDLKPDYQDAVQALQELQSR